jgi:hypothetical protein
MPASAGTAQVGAAAAGGVSQELRSVKRTLPLTDIIAVSHRRNEGNFIN